MTTLAQKIWDQLGAPLDLVDKGKYGPEKGFKWKFVETAKDFAGSNDLNFWQKNKDKDLIELFNQGLASDHVCQPDENFRCKQCGKILKWVVYGSNKIMKPLNIFYYDFNYIVHEKRNQNQIITYNYTEINYLIIQREFTLYTLCRQSGTGYSDYIAIRSQQIPKAISELKFTGDKFHNEFEFYGDFESANLKTMVIDKQAEHCQILLKSDSNSLGFAQWFYFGVKFWGNQPRKVRISILNQKKTHSLFSKGMKFYVGQLDPVTGLTWEQYSQDIQYCQSEFRRMKKEDEPIDGPVSEFFNKLSFDYTFKSSGERVLFSYYKPYTFSDLIEMLEKVECALKKKEGMTEEFSTKTRTTFIQTENTYYKKEIIGGSRLGLSILMLEITSPKKIKVAIPYEKRKIILIFGRQHPFETPSSLVCQGFINFLVSDDPIAIKLKNMYIFKIVPMVNPDGVVIGNSRTNLSGADLNRSWENPSENLHPEVFFIKNYLTKLKEKKKDIFIFIDLHATATKYNSFIVGCEQAHGLSSNFNWVSNRLITKIMQESMGYFREKKCNFNLKQKSQCTARVVLWKEFKAKYSFNFEFSMHGYKLNEYFLSQQYKLQERNKLKSLLQEGQIDYDEYAEMVDQIRSPSLLTISDQFTNRSNRSQINEHSPHGKHSTKSQLYQIANSSNASSNSPYFNRKFSSQSNEEKKKVPTVQFKLEDYEQMGVDICHNILKFSLITSLMQMEVEKSGLPDLDISKVQKEFEIGGDQQENKSQINFDRNNSFSSKLMEMDSNTSIPRKNSTKKIIGTSSPKSATKTPQSPLAKEKSFSFKSNKLTRKDSTLQRKDSTLSRKDSTLSRKDSMLSRKDSMLSRKDSMLSRQNSSSSLKEIGSPKSSNKLKPQQAGGKSNFFQKLQKKILLRKSSQEESSDGSFNSLSNSMLNNSESQGFSKYGFKLNLGDLSSQHKGSIEIALEDDKQIIKTPQKRISGGVSEVKILQKQSSFAIQSMDNKSPMNIHSNSRIEKRQSSQFNIERESPAKQKKSTMRLQNLTNPPLINMSNFDPGTPLSAKSQNIQNRSNPQSPGASPLNNYFGKTPSLLNTKASVNTGSNQSKIRQRKGKSKNKLTFFVKYVIGQCLNIKNLFPDMRSYDWVDYFTFEEIEIQLGEQGVEFKLIQMMNQNMETIFEYDTDSDPEDDLIESFSKYYDMLNKDEEDITERQNIIKDLQSQFGDKFKDKLKGQKIDDLQGLLDGSHEMDENGKIVKKKEANKQKGNESGSGDSQNIWLSNLKKNRSRQESLSSNRSPKGNRSVSQDIEDTAYRSNSSWARRSNYSNSKRSPEQRNEYFEQYKQSKNYNYTSKLLLPKLEVVKLKNPFLPSNYQVHQLYNSKNIAQVLKEERQLKAKHNNNISGKRQDLMQVTAYDKKGYDREKQIEIDPFLCMAGSNFFSPSKTIQQKQSNSPFGIPKQLSLKNLRGTQTSIKDSMNSSVHNYNHSSSYSTSNQSKNFNMNFSKSRKESDDFPYNNISIYKNNPLGNQDFVKEESIAYKVTNSQFGSLILPVNKQIDNMKLSKPQQQKQTKTLIIYQSRINKDPYQISSLNKQKQWSKQNVQIPYKQQTIEEEDSSLRDESKKTVISFYRKQNKES